MKKKLLAVLLLVVLTAGCGKVPKLSNGEEAIVSFDKEKLSISATKYYENIKSSALTKLIDMIDNQILLDKYPKKEDDATKYVNEQFDSIKKVYVDDNGKYDESALLEALYSYYGISNIDTFKEMLRLSYYRNLVIDDYAKENVTDKEIEKYYKDEIYGDIECSHILIKPETTDDMTDEEIQKAEKKALKTAKEVIKKLKAGEKFADLAKEYSADTSKDDGGSLGYFNKGTMVDEFWEAAIKLKKDEYTKEPVKTEFGYHIILKTGEKDKKALEDVKDEIIEEIANKAKESDATLQTNALADLRKEYGMNIEDDELKSLYENYISNQLINAQNKNNNN